MFRVIALSAALVFAASATVQAKPPVQPQHVEIVICLDVSGSMDGLVNQAKIKLWDVVNEFSKVKPTPELRVGLYSYGHTTYDPRAGWVRKEIDLSTDLDEVYKKLNGLTINGGEEYVARVCHDALTDQKWSEEKNALKLIFVCGNEPVDQDKQVHLNVVADLAKKKGVQINTIYCNWGHPEEIAGWRDFAAAANGKFAQIEHNKSIVQIAAPQDKELLALNAKLNATYVAFHSRGAEAKKENQLEQDKNAAGAGAPAAAGRVMTKGGAFYRNADWCIVCKAIEQKDFDITKVPEDQLPEELKKMKPEERVTWLKAKIAEREKVQKEIAEISAQRGRYIAEEMKKHTGAEEKALETALKAMIKDEAAAKGIKIQD